MPDPKAAKAANVAVAPLPADAEAPVLAEVVAVPPAPAVSNEPVVISIDDFCAHRSNSERRVELLSAFAAITSRTKQYGTAAEFEGMFLAFCNAPA